MTKHIVVVDDDHLILEMAEVILTKAGYSVATADSHVYSNNLIYGRQKPDLIILDVIMPFMSGDSKVKALKRREQSSQIPTLLLSSRPEDELQRLVADSGADGYICKPFNEAQLLQRVEDHLN